MTSVLLGIAGALAGTLLGHWLGSRAKMAEVRRGIYARYLAAASAARQVMERLSTNGSAENRRVAHDSFATVVPLYSELELITTSTRVLRNSEQMLIWLEFMRDVASGELATNAQIRDMTGLRQEYRASRIGAVEAMRRELRIRHVEL